MKSINNFTKKLKKNKQYADESIKQLEEFYNDALKAQDTSPKLLKAIRSAQEVIRIVSNRYHKNTIEQINQKLSELNDEDFD